MSSRQITVDDILNAINYNKELVIRSPEHVRPWQHVIEPIYGYVLLAQKQYQKKIMKLKTIDRKKIGNFQILIK